MAASKRGAVYWATLAFGGLFIGGTMGGELIYYKYFKKERDEEIAQVSVKFVWACFNHTLFACQDRDEETKLQKFAQTEIEKRESDGETKEEAEKEVLETIKSA